MNGRNRDDTINVRVNAVAVSVTLMCAEMGMQMLGGERAGVRARPDRKRRGSGKNGSGEKNSRNRRGGEGGGEQWR